MDHLDQVNKACAMEAKAPEAPRIYLQSLHIQRESHLRAVTRLTETIDRVNANPVIDEFLTWQESRWD